MFTQHPRRSAAVCASLIAASAAGIAIAPATASASPFAVSVVDYVPGNLPAPEYHNPIAALGKTRPFSEGMGFPGYAVTPFNAVFDTVDLTGIGPGGHLVLQLGMTAPTGQGHTLGVHAGVGLIDVDWPNGNTGPVASPFTGPRDATVRVSDDGVEWHSLGDFLFDMPTNWWSQGITTPGASATGGTVEADFTQPFVATLSDFDNLDWQGVLGLLDGSAGGKWLDLSGVPFAGVNFVEFSVSEPGQVMYVDAIVTIPEPAGVGAALALTALGLRRRRCRR